MEDFDVNYDPWDVTGRDRERKSEEPFAGNGNERVKSARDERVEKSVYPDEYISYTVTPVQQVDDE